MQQVTFPSLAPTVSSDRIVDISESYPTVSSDLIGLVTPSGIKSAAVHQWIDGLPLRAHGSLAPDFFINPLELSN